METSELRGSAPTEASPTSARSEAPTAIPRRWRRPRAQLLLLCLVIPALMATACKPGRVIQDAVNDVVDEVVDIIGLGENEIATPEFEITNGIKIRVVIKATDAQGGLPVVVHVRCAGGTNASQTLILEEAGSLSIGETTFNQGWPAGADCLVSQEIVQGVEVVRTGLQWLDGNVLEANFLNA